MRYARLLDYRRRLITKVQKWTSRVDSLTYVDIPTLGSMDLLLSSPLTVLCGPNGIGKSTLLGVLRAALEGAAFDGDNQFSRKVGVGSASVSFKVGGLALQNDITFAPGAIALIGGQSLPVTFINTGAAIPQLQSELAEFDDREDLINGVGWRTVTAPDLADINYILKRDYESVTIWEVETSGIVPFFEVVHGNDRYDSTTMGAGELAALYIWWKLSQMDKGAFVFIEEPETFLSTATQGAIGDFILSRAYDLSICVIMTSHSAPIISPLPNDSLKFLFRSQGRLKLASKPTMGMLRSIGIDHPVTEILFVEDNAARVFTGLLLDHLDPQLAARIQIEVCNGHGGITTSLVEFKSFEGPVRGIGMYDGDHRAQIAEDLKTEPDRRAMCLPGDEAIEVTFRKLLRAQMAEVATLRAVPQEHLEGILHAAEGADHHDWYEAVCRGLGLNKDQLLANLFTVWLRHDTNLAVAQEWDAELRQIMVRGRSE